MAKIKRTRGAEIKRIARRADMFEMQFGATVDQVAHRRGFKIAERKDVPLERFKKYFVADERDLHGFHVAGAFVTGRQRGKQLKIIDDCERRRKSANEILFTKGVDTVFHAHPGV